MLGHAFDVIGCVRVEFHTDAENERSRAALRRIGAYEEGTLRNYLLGADRKPRHIVVYSIIDSEWEAVKAHLQRLLDPPKSQGK
jgi:RimJ/RimL family protein N-acetyltransferase